MRNKTRYKLMIGLRIFGLLVFVLLIGFMVYVIDRSSDTYANKNLVQSTMSKTIRNGGSIDEVRHIFETRQLKEMPLFVNSSDFIDSSYRSEVPLSHILADLLVDYYMRNPADNDTLYITRLHEIVEDYNAVHPFDALEEGQKYYLENIRQKLDSNYILIQDDILKLGDELDRKNLLVNKYLEKSELSFWISILAVVITVFLSFWQIRQNIKTNKTINQLLPSKKQDINVANQKLNNKTQE